MPIYCYHCTECKHEFEETKKLADYEVPCKNPCPNCQSPETVHIVPQACGLSFRGEVRRKPPGHFNDKLKEIKKKHPGNKINVIE